MLRYGGHREMQRRARQMNDGILPRPTPWVAMHSLILARERNMETARIARERRKREKVA